MKGLMALIGERARKLSELVSGTAQRLARADRRKLFAGALGTALVLSGGAALTNAWIDRYAASHLYPDVSSAPRRKVVIVPGCRVYSDGTPTPILVDRLATARELYLRGSAQKILVSGDHAAPEYDEVNAMRRWLVARDVPSADIYLDHAGLRTLDTMERARRVFGVTEAAIATQEFHLPRAVFLARRAGIDAVGVRADRRAYRAWARNHWREFFAKGVSFVDSYLLRSEPRHLGDPHPIDGEAATTHDRWTRGD
jgi:SanA protein